MGMVACLIFGAAGAALIQIFRAPVVAIDSEVEEATYAVANATQLPSPTAIPTVALREGWVMHGGIQEGFTLVLPSGWMPLDLEAETMADAMAPVQTQALDLENSIIIGWNAQALQSKGLEFAAIHAVEHDFRYYAVVDVRCERAEAPISLDAVVQEVIYAYPNLGRGILSNERDSLPAGEAERFELTAGTDDPRSTIQYLLVEGRRACFVTLSCDAQARARYDETFDRIIESFRWLAMAP
jgi:hypothetical protein